MSLGFLVISPGFSRQVLLAPSIAISAARAGATAVIDAASAGDNADVIEAFRKLAKHAGSATIGLRIRIDQVGLLTDPVRAGQPAQQLIAILAAPADLSERDFSTAVAAARKAGFSVYAECVNLKEAKRAQAARVDAIIAKGNEAGGRVGDTTSFVLVQQVVDNVSLPVWVQGGIGIHSAAAMSIAGAAGVVLDSQLYLCRDSQLPADARSRMERLDGSASEPALGVGSDGFISQTLAKVGGTVSGAIDVIRDAVADHIHSASRTKVLSEGAPLAQSHGTRFPIVQGAMTRVSDTSDFAAAVAEGGGLPFLALSLLRGADIETLLVETKAKLGSKPWGVGLLGFVPQQLRQEQMEVVNRHKPPFALIAGGRPDQAKSMEDAGTATYLHVPSPILLKSFIEMGSKRFIFEGKECGGHVGPRSSMVLWEAMIEVLLECVGPRDNPSDFHVLFAGGIHDDLSAAMTAAMAAPLSARGIKVGMLVGTAYLFTKEAVETGAIVEKFQAEALKCDETVLLETGPGHSIRCIASPYKQTFDQQREELQRQNKNRDDIREELELMNLGRLRIASKGVSRNGKGNELVELPAEQQWQEGMYMIGQVAALHNELTTIEALHTNIGNHGQRLLESKQVPEAQHAEDQPAGEPIAIVGMSCLFPKANDLEAYWQNILNRVDAIEEIPETHFDWKNYYDANPLAKDKIVSKWGGFLQDIVFDPSRYGIPPSSLDSIDPMQVLILEAARTALHDAGYTQRKYPRDKTSVILANAGHGPITALYSLRSMLGWKLSDLDESTKREIESRLPGWTEDSFAGYLGNVTAGRVANRFDLKGINFSIDAACASSLAALYVGINDLRSGASDVVLLGATDTHNQPGDYLSFSKTHALSSDGRCKTFDASADGIVISEGIAMLVLKRLSDAERAGDRIYAVIRGIGGSSDGRDLSLTAPRPAGQMLALQRAYADAGVNPSTVGLIEAHGTGTTAGDKAEVEALTKVFQQFGADPQSCAIGSVKTNIGHSKAAAGLASIVKVAKALHHKVLPPTINVKTPNPACKFGEGPFYLNTESRPWLASNESQPRRAGVSAFGFGGTNFHAVLEEYVPACVTEESPAVVAWPAELFVWKAKSLDLLLKAVAQTEAAARKIKPTNPLNTDANAERKKLFDLASKLVLKSAEETADSTAVLTLVANSIDALEQKIQQFKAHVEKSPSVALSQVGLHFSPAAKRTPLAFLFPGQGSQRVNMLRELMIYFPELRQSVQDIDAQIGDALGRPLSSFVFPPPALTDEEKKAQLTTLTATQVAQPAIGASSLAVLQLLNKFGVTPDMVAGHSYGEYTALHAAGVFSADALFKLSIQRGNILADCAGKNPGSMAAAVCDIDTAKDVIAGIENVYLANINTPQQCIISGSVQGIDEAIARFKARNLTCNKITVSAAFHTPLMDASKQPLARALKATTFAAPQIPVWSNTTGRRHESKPQSISGVLEEHALKPVLFAQQLADMHEAGARTFLEVGPGAVLTGLTEATLKGKDFVAVSTEGPAKTTLEHFLNMLAILLVNGVPVDARKLFWNRKSELALGEEFGEPAKNKLLYRVNSVRMEKIGNNGNKPMNANNNGHENNGHQNNGHKKSPVTAASASAPVAKTAAQPPVQAQQQSPQQAPAARPQVTGAPAQSAPQRPSVVQRPAARTTDGSVEKVMLEFQQSMLQMTNRFLETQQNVMLAYLQSNGKLPEGLAPTVSAPAMLVSPVLAAPAAATPQYTTVDAVQINQSSAAAKAVTETLAKAIAPQQQVVEATTEVAAIPETEAEAEAGLDKEALVESLYEIVGDRTGYPREMLDPTLDLEADLGIDSIKRVEILNNFRKLLPDTVQEQLESGIEKLAGTKTLQGVIDWIYSLEVDAGATSPQQDNHLSFEVGSTDNVARGIVSVKSLPAPTATAKTLVKAVVIIDKNVDEQKLRSALGANGNNITIVSRADAKQYFALAKQFETEMRAQASNSNRTAWVNVTRLGGNFAITPNAGLALGELVEEAATIGLTKTIAKEWTDVHVKTLDFNSIASEAVIAESVLSELFADDHIVEVGFADGKRITLDVAAAPFADQPNLAVAPLSSSSVVLVTGGARGITAEIAMDIGRRYRPTFIIVGRLQRPADKESGATAGLESAKDIKAAIIEQEKQNGNAINIREIEKAFQQLLREREVRKTLSELEATGSKVKYYSVDVTDEAAFGKLIDSIYETARIDGVIHGAGIIEDALIKDKTAESFGRVFDTKVKSALTLAQKLRFDELKFLFFFSSVVGRTGNAGQADYVSANEALNKLAVVLNAKQQARVASLMWGPWQAGMAPPELEEVFARHGWSMIQPQDGRLCFSEEILKDCNAQSEVLLVGKLARKPEAVKASGALLHTARYENAEPPTFGLTINTREHLYLHDHKFDGIPVMPMAVALEMMLEAGQSLFPDRQILSVSNLDIPAGVVFHSDKKDFVLTATPDQKRDGVVALNFSAAGSPQKLHFRCKAEYTNAPYTVPEKYLTALSNEIPTTFDAKQLPTSVVKLPEPKDIYGTWLFHGPIFQGMTGIRSLHNNGICGEVVGCRPERFVTFADGSDWILDPVLLDSAMQLAGVWARADKDVTVLPAGFKTMRFFRQIGSGKVTAQIFLTEAAATELLCDLAIYDQDGNLAMVIEALGGIASKAFNRFSSQSPVRELV